MAAITQFTDAAAAEAWDTWFRWRELDGLRDRTIDSTWWRVANAIAAAEGSNAALWAYRFVDAFSHWRLLPDERLLRLAGTDHPVHGPAPLSATLNLAAFVISPRSKSARLDGARLADVAALAVRMLDDALRMCADAEIDRSELRIGVLGMADALQALNVPYDSPQAGLHAREVATALANGTVRGSVELACERGVIESGPGELVAHLHQHGAATALIEDAARWGIRHQRLTAIESHPRLALLANNASDALDPRLPAPAPPGELARAPATVTPNRAVMTPVSAQLTLRAAMQPWIDATIDYPIAIFAEPGPHELEAAARLAGEHGLPPPRFRPVAPIMRARTDLPGDA